jgi:type IV pilus assembly protein PilM
MRKTSAVRSLLYAGDLLAVDLGTSAIKVLHLRAKERSLTVFASAQKEVWGPLAEAKTDEEKAEIYSSALKELLAAQGVRIRNASISLSGSVVILRFLSLPAGFKVDAKTGLPFEARAMIPFDEPDPAVSMLTQDDAETVKSARTEVMFAVAQKKTVQGAMDIVRAARLRPAVIVNDAVALANAYEFFHGKQLGETVVLVNAGASSTSACVVEGGVPKAARVFNIAGNTFTRAVKRELAVEQEEAEKLKILHGMTVPEGRTPEEKELASRVARSLVPAVKDLSGEILRTIDVFHERRPADYPPIRRIILAGGSAALKGLAERLAADTGMTVEVFRPMVNVTVKGGGLGIAPLEPALAVSCGLGLSNTLLRRSLKNRLNLVPKKTRRAAIIREITPGFWRLIAVPVIAGFVFSLYGVWAVRVARKEAAEEQKLEAAAKAAKASHAKLQKKHVDKTVVKRAENPFGFLSRMTASGVFGDVVMLNGGGTSYVARGGRLYDANEKEVPGVTAEIRDNSLSLTAGGGHYSIALPK